MLQRRRAVSRWTPGTVAVLVGLSGAAPFVARTAHGQAVASRGISIEEVVRVTLSRAPSVRAALMDLEAERGGLVEAAAVLTPMLDAGISRSRDAGALGGAPGSDVTTSPTHTVAYTVSAAKRFRSGITLVPEIAASGTGSPSFVAAAPAAGAQASVRLGLVVPLMHDRLGSVSVAPVRAFGRSVAARLADVEHAAAMSVFQALSAYWRYRYGMDALAIFRASEGRAARMVEDTRALVSADERSPAELGQVRATLALRRLTRLGAEQAVADARVALGVEMGLPAGDIQSLGAPMTGFPAPAAGMLDSLPDLVALAGRQRADLRSIAFSRQSAELMRDAAAAEARPVLDLTLSAGYAGSANGLGLEGYVGALHRNVPGLSASAGVQYRLPLGASGAVGRLLQRDAGLRRQRYAQDELARIVETEVSGAITALQSAILALAQAQEARTLSQEGVDAQLRMFRLGSATLFNVQQAEDALVSALLGELAAQRDHALAIARLRVATGTLVAGESPAFVVDDAALVTPPSKP